MWQRQKKRRREKSVRVNKMTRGRGRRNGGEWEGKKVETTFYPLHHRHILTLLWLSFVSSVTRLRSCAWLNVVMRSLRWHGREEESMWHTKKERKNGSEKWNSHSETWSESMMIQTYLFKSNRHRVTHNTKKKFTRLVDKDVERRPRKLNKFFISCHSWKSCCRSSPTHNEIRSGESRSL